MSLQESDFSSIIKILAEINKKYKNPALAEKLIQECIKNYNIIPVYPGIVSMTLSKMIKPIKKHNYKKGDWITFDCNDKKYAGTISQILKDKIQLQSIVEISKKKSIQINKKQIKNIHKINKDQLKEDWPMLIFNGEK